MRPEYIIGIDVGCTGALCRLDIHHLTAEFFDIPVGKFKTAKDKTFSRVNEERLKIMIQKLAGIDTVLYVVEYQQAFGLLSRATTFKLADCFGLLRGLIISINKPLITVKPREWKKEFSIIKTDGMTHPQVKEMSRQKALELFPNTYASLKRKQDHNRAEALLIAEFARRNRLERYIPNYKPFKTDTIESSLLGDITDICEEENLLGRGILSVM